MTPWALAIRGMAGITLFLVVVFAKASADRQKLGSKRFYSGTIVLWGIWAVVAGLWLVFSFLSAFADNPQNGFEPHLIGPSDAATVILTALAIVLLPSVCGFMLDRRDRRRAAELPPPVQPVDHVGHSKQV